MISVKEIKPAYFNIDDGESVYKCYIDEKSFLKTDAPIEYRELAFLTLINKCMTLKLKEVYAYDEWGVDLSKYGFERENDYFKLQITNYNVQMRKRCALD